MIEDKTISTIIEVYKDVCLVPSVNSAVLRPVTDNLLNVFSTWSIPDVIRSESTKFSREFILEYNSGNFTLLSTGIPSDTSSVCQSVFTKSGKKCALFRKTNKNEDSIFLEIWTSSKKESTFDLSDSKEHGAIQSTGVFNSFEWSSDEKYLLYIADAKQRKSESYFKDAFCQKSDPKSNGDIAKVEDKPAEETAKGEEFRYKETWGEQYTSSHHTVLCVFDVALGKTVVLNFGDEYSNMSVAEATWGPNDECIIFVGYEESPRLGLVFCTNRRSAIFSYNMKSKVVEQLSTKGNIAVCCPVFSPDFEKFIYLENSSGGPHKSTHKLMKLDWKTKEVSTLIDIVDIAYGDDFTGVYSEKLSPKYWSKDSRFFFFNTIRRSFVEMYCVDVFSSKIQRIDFGDHQYSCFLLDVKDPYIIASVSSCNNAPCLVIGHFVIDNDKIQTTWSFIDNESSCKLKDLSWKVDTLVPPLQNEKFSTLDFDIITLWSEAAKNGTLIIFPHGGPHSAFSVSYMAHSAAFARLGFIVCHVNYRGSVGFGENSIKSLLGNVGTQDVSDVVNAAEFLKKDKSFNIKNVVGYGGSHGGFLIAHLLGQYPDLLKAAVLRNPVIDLTSMEGSTDIPDWCWVESGCSETYDALKIVDPACLKILWEKSPIRYVKNVVSPTLLSLGKGDLRVPAFQGFQFYKHLKNQKVPTKAYYYDDNHSLSKVGVSSDGFVHTVLWFKEHLAHS